MLPTLLVLLEQFIGRRLLDFLLDLLCGRRLSPGLLRMLLDASQLVDKIIIRLFGVLLRNGRVKHHLLLVSERLTGRLLGQRGPRLKLVPECGQRPVPRIDGAFFDLWRIELIFYLSALIEVRDRLFLLGLNLFDLLLRNFLRLVDFFELLLLRHWPLLLAVNRQRHLLILRRRQYLLLVHSLLLDGMVAHDN